MALNFPISPVEGDTYIDDNNVTYIFTGTKWRQEVTNYNYTGYSPSSANNSTEIDLSQGNFFNVELTEKTNISFVNPPDSGYSQKFQLKLRVPEDYNAATNYSIKDMTYDNVSYLAFPQTPEPTATGSATATGIYFKPDGTKMYLMGSISSGYNSGTQQNEYVYQYSLSTPWDISTASYDNVYANTFTTLGYWGNSDIQFKPDGTAFFTTIFGSIIKRFNLSTPWDISTTSYSGIFFDQLSLNYVYPQPKFYFSDDGLKLYTSSYTTDMIYEYDLASPWDISDVSYNGKYLSVGSEDGSPFQISFNKTGSRMYMSGGVNSKIYEYSIRTPWDISSGLYTGISYNYGNDITSSLGFFIKPNGGKIYLGGYTDKKLYQYDISGFTTIPEIIWNDNIVWEGEYAPNIPQTNEINVYEFYTNDNGLTYYGKLSEEDVK